MDGDICILCLGFSNFHFLAKSKNNYFQQAMFLVNSVHGLRVLKMQVGCKLHLINRFC